MGSLLNTLLCIIHYSWANARGQVIILIVSPCLYFYNYSSLSKEFILLNILVFNLIQVVMLNLTIKSNELVRFLNFYNVPDIIFFSARLLFLYCFVLIHLVLFFVSSSITIRNFFILNLMILVFIAFKLVSLTLNRKAVLTIFIFLFLFQIAVLLLISLTIIITY